MASKTSKPGSKSNKNTEQVQPMDPSVRENATATPATNNQRPCYAAKTLVSEVNALFPETPVEYSNHDGRNTALDVTFDLTTLDPPESSTLIILLDLTDGDSRVREVLIEDGAMLVGFKANPRTQDSREPFGLADALDVLALADDTDEQVAP